MDDSEEAPRISMFVHSSHLPAFHSLLQGGVSVETPTGITVKAFLCGELGVSMEYLDTVIQTIFLDGKAVDDMDSTLMENGSTLALSAAMPGLLGATLRRGSFYAAMRKEISHQFRQESATSGRGMVKVKVFNLLLKELGRILLTRGIHVQGGDLQALFARVGRSFWNGCREARLNDRKIEPETLRDQEWGDKEVFLKVVPAD